MLVINFPVREIIEQNQRLCKLNLPIGKLCCREDAVTNNIPDREITGSAAISASAWWHTEVAHLSGKTVKPK